VRTTEEAAGKMSTEATKVAARNVILSAKNHYEVMSLSKDCEEDEVKKRHRELVRMVHPDKLQLSSDSENLKTQQAFRAVQVAYETLSVSHKRKSYDLQLTMSSGGSRFVPGESNGEDSTGDEMDEGPSIATDSNRPCRCCVRWQRNSAGRATHFYY